MTSRTPPLPVPRPPAPAWSPASSSRPPPRARRPRPRPRAADLPLRCRADHRRRGRPRQGRPAGARPHPRGLRGQGGRAPARDRRASRPSTPGRRRRGAARRRRPWPATSRARGATGRAFAIVVDDVSPRPRPDRRRARGRRAVRRALRARAADLVTVATTSGDAWWSARIPEGREDLLAVLDRVRGRARRRADPRAHDGVRGLLDRAPRGLPVRRRPSRRARASRCPAAASGSAAEPVPPGSIKERVKQRWQQANLCLPIYCDSLVRARAAEIDGARRARVCDSRSPACAGRSRPSPPSAAASRCSSSRAGFLQDSGSDARAVAGRLARGQHRDLLRRRPRPRRAARLRLGRRPGALLDRARAHGQWPSRRPRSSPRAPRGWRATPAASPCATRTTSRRAPGASPPSRASSTSSASTRPRARPAASWRNLRVEVKRPGLTVRARRGYTLRSEMAVCRAAAEAGRGRPRAGRRSRRRPRPRLGPRRGRASRCARSPTCTSRGPGGVVHVLVAAELDASASHAARTAPPVSRSASPAEMRDSGRRSSARTPPIRSPRPRATAPPGARSPASSTCPPAWPRFAWSCATPRAARSAPSCSGLEVPFPGELRVSTPILTDRVEPGQGPGERPRPARRRAPRRSPRAARCTASTRSSAPRAPAVPPPRVAARFSMRSRDGDGRARGAGHADRRRRRRPPGAARGRLARGPGRRGRTSWSSRRATRRPAQRVVRREPFALTPPGRDRAAVHLPCRAPSARRPLSRRRARLGLSSVGPDVGRGSVRAAGLPRVELITVDAVVLDKEGQPVPGLTKATSS